MFELPPLNFSRSALEPFLSTETVDYHYGKHHKIYIDEVNCLIPGTRFENSSLEEIVLLSNGALQKAASQAWNHTFYWSCLSSLEVSERSRPPDMLIQKIRNTFGSMRQFEELFTETAMQIFGSGWVWLVADSEKRLRVLALADSESPMREGLRPLLACDVWEHAYYIDYRNSRGRYVDGFLGAIDWNFVTRNFTSDKIPEMGRLMRVPGV